MFFFFLFSVNSIYSKLLQISHPVTLYCGCAITSDQIHCGKDKYPFSIEHIVPKSFFSRGDKLDPNSFEERIPVFNDFENDFENDLHNQVLEPRFINNIRSNLPFAESASPFLENKKVLDSCELVLQKDRVILPKDWRRGFVARIFLYIQLKYSKNVLTEEELNMFSAWDQTYPPLKQECKRNEEILKIQGNSNPFIAKHCEEADHTIDVAIYDNQPLFTHDFKYFHEFKKKGDTLQYSFKIPTSSSASFYELLTKNEGVNCIISTKQYYYHKRIPYYLQNETIIECTSSANQEKFLFSVIEDIYKSRT